MDDVNCYCIQIQGRMEEDEINATSPIAVRVDRVDVDTTRLVVTTDQSGLIGLLRHLHGRGIVLLHINRH